MAKVFSIISLCILFSVPISKLINIVISIIQESYDS